MEQWNNGHESAWRSLCYITFNGRHPCVTRITRGRRKDDVHAGILTIATTAVVAAAEAHSEHLLVLVRATTPYGKDILELLNVTALVQLHMRIVSRSMEIKGSISHHRLQLHTTCHFPFSSPDVPAGPPGDIASLGIGV